MELINARVKSGAIEPISRPIILKSFNEEYSKGFFHASAKKYLFIKGSDRSIVSYNDKFDEEELLSSSVIDVQDIQFIGYILCAMTANGIHYFRYKTDYYYYIGQKPSYSFSISTTGEEENIFYTSVHDKSK